MRIELKEPFLNNYKAGYLLMNKEPRRLILLIRFDNSKTSLSYSRYLMSCKLNRYLEKHEHVDHIDGDKLNDSIENLQILSQKENNIKSIIETKRSAKYTKFICPVCNSLFVRKSHNFSYRPNYIPTCSRRCGGIISHKK